MTAHPLAVIRDQVCAETGRVPYFQSERALIFHADCRDILPVLPALCVDHVITDPPYSRHVHTNTRTNQGTDGRSGGAEIDLGFEHLHPVLRVDVAHDIRRLVRRWSLVFCDVESSHLWREALCTPHGLPAAHPHEYIRTGAWVKSGAMPQVTGDRPGAGFESIVITHATKADGRPGRKRWNGGGRAAVWQATVPRSSGGRVHPTEKPWELLRRLVADFTDEGDVVLDPFAGSGSLARGALDLPGRHVVLVEAEERWCAQAASRLGAPVPDRGGQCGLRW